MKLYLSSFRLGESKLRLADMANGMGPVAFVPNALDFFDDEAKKADVIRRGIDDLQGIGLECDVIDLREYFGSSVSLRARLSEHRVIFLSGGNVFILRRALRQSGLDTLLKEKKNDRGFVYAGYSAGACVCGPTLDGLDLVDDPKTVPDGYLSDVIWEGLSLIDENIAPHFDSDHPETNQIDKVVEYWTSNRIPFRPLRDGEVFIQD